MSVISNNKVPFVETHRILLTREEEEALFNRWYVAKGRHKDALLAQIVRSYSPIIRATIREFSGYHADPEELISEGLIALVQAAKRYDMESGFRFSTFAKSWVRGVMLGYITKNYFPVNLCTSHNKKKLFFAIRRLIAANLRECGSFEMSQALAEELSAEYDVKIRDVYAIYEMIRKPPVSLSDPIHNDESDGLTRGDHIECRKPTAEETLIDECRHTFHRTIIDEVINTVLDDRERSIFEMQVLAPKEDSLTLEQLGEKWNVSRERIRQIRDKANDKVHEAVIERVKEMGMESTDIL